MELIVTSAYELSIRLPSTGIALGRIFGIGLHTNVECLPSVLYAEHNCLTSEMREPGYSEKQPSRIRKYPTQWHGLIPGSNKSDLTIFVCK